MMSKMHKFLVFDHVSRGRVAVKAGFSWPALILGVLFSSMGCIVWLFFNRLWRFGVLWCAILVIFIFLDNAVRTSIQDPALQTTLQIVLFVSFFLSSIVPAFKGNAWKAERFSALGYAQVCTVYASSSHNALAKAEQDSPTPPEK
jgi:FtsH-binding integral membrane protein